LCGLDGRYKGARTPVSILGAVKSAARSLLRRLGVEAIAYAPRNFLELRRPLLLEEEQIDLVLDVGAGDGGWARGLRERGYAGRIVSFEPLPESFAALDPGRDGGWDAHRVALGARAGRRELQVSANRVSSSLLPMAELHLRAAPESAVTGAIEVEVARLDDLDVVRPADRVYLKIDVQGTELDVLQGATASLASVRLLEAELSTVTLYEGQPLIGEVIQHVQREGFDLIALERAFRDRETGDVLQVNGLFRRGRS
jgi:FkbM family methyltransferase